MNDTASHSTLRSTSPETVIMSHLSRHPSMTFDDLIEHVPQLTWNQIFHAVDGLTRTGAVVARRIRFQYELSLVC